MQLVSAISNPQLSHNNNNNNNDNSNSNKRQDKIDPILFYIVAPLGSTNSRTTPVPRFDTKREIDLTHDDTRRALI